MEDQQTEMAKCWAGERMRQMHTIQLGWIHSYAWKKKQGPDAQLERSFNLAKMAVQFIVRQVLERLFTYNKDLFANLAKLSRRQRNTLFMNFLMTYMEGAYGDAITLRHGDKQSDDKHELVKTSKMRKGENSKDDAAWSLLCNLFPGTVLRSLRFDLFVFSRDMTKKYLQLSKKLYPLIGLTRELNG
ncbi:unnamed protein product [Litomosoides sigmodontis]|uniref:Uncharacterized protein n=1 Tax=Litomosoides sigmodontis TaxID=42156 RepID=A0A3P6TZD5_LITSI|nr:unnamed protein product [Litomosoides sigmodontis]